MPHVYLWGLANMLNAFVKPFFREHFEICFGWIVCNGSRTDTAVAQNSAMNRQDYTIERLISASIVSNYKKPPFFCFYSKNKNHFFYLVLHLHLFYWNTAMHYWPQLGLISRLFKVAWHQVTSNTTHLQQETFIRHLCLIKRKKYKMYCNYFYIFTMTQGKVGFWSAGGYALAKKLINILVIAALTRHEHSVLITAKNSLIRRVSNWLSKCPVSDQG